MRKNIGEKLARHCITHSYIYLFIGLLLTLLATITSRHLRINADMVDLLPQNFESVQAIKKLTNEFTSGNLIVVVENQDHEKIQQFIDQLAGFLQNRQDIAYVEWKRPIIFFKQHQLYYLETADLTVIEDRFKKQSRLSQGGIHPFFQNMIGLVDKESDPFDFSDIFKKYQSQVFKDDFKEEYFADWSQNMAVLIIFPKEAGLNIQKNTFFVEGIQKAITLFQKEKFPGENIKISYTGSLQNSLETHARLIHSFKKVSLLIFFSLLLVILIYYRRLTTCVLLGVAMATSSLWTLGLTTFCFGSLNFISSFSIGLVLGLGSDYGIYYLTRYLQERKDFKTSQSFIKLHQKTLKSIFWACVVTLLAILPFGFSNFKGYAEFAWISMLGTACNFFTFIFIFPTMVSLFDKWNFFDWEEKHIPDINPLTTLKVKFHFSITIIAFCTIGSLASLPYMKDTLKVEHDITKLEHYTPPLPSLDWEKKLSTIFSRSLRPAVILVDSEEEELEIVNILKQKMQRDAKTPILEEVVSLSGFVPGHQEEKIPILKNIQKTIASIKASPLVKRYLPQFPETIAPFGSKDLPPTITHIFNPTGQTTKRLVLLYPAITRNNIEKIKIFRDYVSNIRLKSGKTVSATGQFLIEADIYNLIQKETPRALLVSFLLIFLMLYISCQNGKQALFLSGMLGITLIMTLGGLKLFGVHLTMFNIVMIPIVLGTSIDSFIHIYHHYFDLNPRNLDLTFQKMLGPTTIATLTTAIGCAGFALVGNEALADISWLAFIGLAVNMITSLGLYPALIQGYEWLQKKKKPVC